MNTWIYKVITIVSLLAGMLGPQVAAGSDNQSVLPAVTPVSKIEQIIPVVRASISEVVIGEKAGSSCITNTDGLMGLMLWQSCDFVLVRSPFVANPSVAVEASQPNPVHIAVTTGPAYKNQGHIAPLTKQLPAIITTGTLFSELRLIIHHSLASFKIQPLYLAATHAPVDHLSMVMRC